LMGITWEEKHEGEEGMWVDAVAQGASRVRREVGAHDDARMRTMTQGCRGVASKPLQSRVGLREEAQSGAPTRFGPVDAASDGKRTVQP
jgi:hypothetical protein